MTGIACASEDQSANMDAVIFMSERLQELAKAFTEALEAGRAQS